SEGDRLGVILVHRDGCPSCNIFEEEVFGTTRVQEWLEKHALLYQTRTAKEVEELFGPYGQENVEVPGIILLDRSAQRLDILKELRLKVTIDGLLERLNRALELR